MAEPKEIIEHMVLLEDRIVALEKQQLVPFTNFRMGTLTLSSSLRTPISTDVFKSMEEYVFKFGFDEGLKSGNDQKC